MSGQRVEDDLTKHQHQLQLHRQATRGECGVILGMHTLLHMDCKQYYITFSKATFVQEAHYCKGRKPNKKLLLSLIRLISFEGKSNAKLRMGYLQYKIL